MQRQVKLSDNNEELSNFSSCKNLFTKGVNLSNWLEVNDIYQIIDDYYTPEDFENIKELGCDVVRIPINFENICVEENDYIPILFLRSSPVLARIV